MDDLTRHQFILLVILVTFVVSLATTISVVTLLQDKPFIPATVNRIVEKTIETIVPGTTTPPEVVREEDIIAQVVQENLPSVVTILIRSWEVASEARVVTGVGFVAQDGGYVVTDVNSLPEQSTYYVQTHDGAVYEMKLVARFDDVKTGVLVPASSLAASRLREVTFAQNAPELGETVIALGGRDARTVRKGIISSVDSAEGEGGAERIISKIFTNADLTHLDSGGLLIDLRGRAVGMNIVSSEGSFTLSAQALLQMLRSTKTQAN